MERPRRSCVVDTGGWLAAGRGRPHRRGARARGEGQRAGRAAMRGRRRRRCSSSTSPSASPRRTRRSRSVLQRAEHAGARRRQQGRRRAPRGRHLGSSRRLGLGDPMPVSAIHGRGTRRPARRGRRRAPARAGRTKPTRDDDEDDGIFSVAIVGRPNVGKSTLFNRLVGEERSVVHDMPGTTRDAIDTIVETDDGPLRFVDTAGHAAQEPDRRADRVLQPRARARRRSTAPTPRCFVIDATEGVTHQDQRLAERVDAAGTAIVIVLNKWDLLDAEERARGQRRRRRPARRSSATRRCCRSRRSPGGDVHHLLPALREAEAAYHRRVPTAALNRVLRDAQAAHPPPVDEAAPAADPLRDPGRDRPADVHAVRDPDAAAARTCATSSARSGSRSTSGPTPIKIRVRAPQRVTRRARNLARMSEWPARVEIREVGPRDGLQNEAPVPVADRVRLIDALSRTGLRRIEAASFVSRQGDPADGRRRRGDGADRPAARRRLLGARAEREGRRARDRGAGRRDRARRERERDAQPEERAAVGRRVARRGARASSSSRTARASPVEAIVSTAFGCPYEGDVAPERGRAGRRPPASTRAPTGSRSATPPAWRRPRRVDDLLDALERAGIARRPRRPALPQHARHRARERGRRRSSAA